MSGITPASDHVILCEMLTHPALFSHPRAKTVAIIGDVDEGILTEVVKHAHVQHIQHITPATTTRPDARVHPVTESSTTWLAHAPPGSLDILIVAEDTQLTSLSHFKACLRALHSHGVLVQLCTSTFDLTALVATHRHLQTSGFADIQLLNFPQPHYQTGWRSAMMASHQGHFKRLSEKNIFNKSFATHFYNFDMHRAALVLPEFMRAELTT